MEKSSWKLCFFAATSDMANGHYAESVEVLRELIMEAHTSKRQRVAQRKLIEALDASGQFMAAEREAQLLTDMKGKRRLKNVGLRDDFRSRLLTETRLQFLRRKLR